MTNEEKYIELYNSTAQKTCPECKAKTTAILHDGTVMIVLTHKNECVHQQYEWLDYKD